MNMSSLQKRLSVLERRVLPAVSAEDVLAYVLEGGGLLSTDFDHMVRRMPDNELAAAIDALKAQLAIMRLKTRIERAERASEATARPYSDWTVERLDVRIEHLLSQLTPSEREQIKREVELELGEKYNGQSQQTS